MYLFVFESIGTMELILIGVVALIILGPRKLPDLARTVGRTMADFRKISSEFKSTWEKEVEEDKKLIQSFARDPEMDKPEEKTIEQSNLAAPKVKELSPAEVEDLLRNKEIPEKSQPDAEVVEEPQAPPTTLSKRDWL